MTSLRVLWMTDPVPVPSHLQPPSSAPSPAASPSGLHHHSRVTFPQHRSPISSLSLCSLVFLVGSALDSAEGQRPQARVMMSQGGCYLHPGAAVLSRFSRVRLCDPVDCSPPGSSVHGVLLARVLEWVALSRSQMSSNNMGW